MGTKQKAFRAALPKTLPICAGFLFLGFAYGVLMRSKGFSCWWPMVMSLTIFAGSMGLVSFKFSLCHWKKSSFVIQIMNLFRNSLLLDIVSSGSEKFKILSPLFSFFRQ